LVDLHEAYVARGDELEHLKAKAESPRLGDLVEKWLDWLDTAVSPRSKRRYSNNTIIRYRSSWNGFFDVLPRGRESALADLTRGFVLDYRRSRNYVAGGIKRQEKPDRPLSGATLNRDMVALGSFLTWVEQIEGLKVDRPQIIREREPEGRMRWLSADELRAFESHCPGVWWPFFATLFFTGARLGEVQGLRGADILLHAKRVTVHESERRVKSHHSVRDLPISRPLEDALAAHLTRVGPGPADLVFPGIFQNYKAARRMWHQILEEAEIARATIHDARHTFGVHAAMAGVPIVRLQKLMGHATATMTMRYMAHAPEAYMQEDATAIADHMGGETDKEAAARVEAARKQMRGL
jgi:integrase